jgi:ribosomal protein L19
MTKGIVYILINPCLEGWVKIGHTDKNDIQERLDTLNNQPNIPLAFRAYALYHTKDPSRIEETIQGLIDLIDPKLRAIELKENGKVRKREFYRMPPGQAFAILKKFAHGIGDEGSLELVNPTIEDIEIETLLKGRRPKLNFYELGLEDGFELVLKENPRMVAKIVSEKLVEHEGNKYSLTALSKKLLHWQAARQPAPHWLYKGKSLSDIYEEKYT